MLRGYEFHSNELVRGTNQMQPAYAVLTSTGEPLGMEGWAETTFWCRSSTCTSDSRAASLSDSSSGHAPHAIIGWQWWARKHEQQMEGARVNDFYRDLSLVGAQLADRVGHATFQTSIQRYMSSSPSAMSMAEYLSTLEQQTGIPLADLAPNAASLPGRRSTVRS